MSRQLLKQPKRNPQHLPTVATESAHTPQFPATETLLNWNQNALAGVIVVQRSIFHHARCALGKRYRRRARGTAKIAFGSRSGETLPDRHQGRRSFHPAATGSGLSRWRVPTASAFAGERGRAKRFDVRSSDPADTARDQG